MRTTILIVIFMPKVKLCNANTSFLYSSYFKFCFYKSFRFFLNLWNDFTAMVCMLLFRKFLEQHWGKLLFLLVISFMES